MLELTRNFVVALMGSLVLVPLCRVAAIRLGLVAKPRQDRWHARPTALMGGLAIALTTLVLSSLLLNMRDVLVLGVGGTLICTLGLVDDVISLRPYTKTVGQIAVASLFVFFGYRLSWSASLTIDTVLTMLWIVGLTNALNLLDNMDGLCGGIAFVAGASLLVAMAVGSPAPGPSASYLALLLGAIAGFLVYNVNPASIVFGYRGSPRFDLYRNQSSGITVAWPIGLNPPATT